MFSLPLLHAGKDKTAQNGQMWDIEGQHGHVKRTDDERSHGSDLAECKALFVRYL